MLWGKGQAMEEAELSLMWAVLAKADGTAAPKDATVIRRKKRFFLKKFLNGLPLRSLQNLKGFRGC
jgi:hypothetical protein